MSNKLWKSAFRAVLLGYLILLVVLPILAVYFKGFSFGIKEFWQAAVNPLAMKSIILTIKIGILTTLVQAVIGTLIAFTLVRYKFFGRQLLNSIVDLPFALPTAVSGVIILTLLSPNSPIGLFLSHYGLSLVYNQTAIFIGMFFITFPFVVRAVQPLLENMDPYEEEASQSLGASKGQTFFRVIVPNILPGIVAGSMLAFSRAIAEFGAISLISGNLPGKTMVASVYIYSNVESYNMQGATAVSAFLLTLSFLILWGIHYFQKKGWEI
jgi:sulfate/thiosulfate transport system permease protein